jgi:apolipoprotein N-acyltransferase
LGLCVALALALARHQDARVAAAERDATPLRVALVQPGGDPEAPPTRTPEQAKREADQHAVQARTAMAADDTIRVVVLPEKALEWGPDRPWNTAVRELAGSFDVEVWTGSSAVDRSDRARPRSHNSAFQLRADGSSDARYDKNVLVPFGEYVPFGDALPWLRAAIGRTPFDPGEGMPLYDAPPARFAFLICYEAILSSYVRDPVQRGANLLVNLTYDGWFGDSAEPAQHLMLVAVQAAQLGVPVIRSTTTGITALLDARGRITARTQLFERTVLVGDVTPLRAPGLYAAWGDWFAWSCVATSIALFLGQLTRRV